MRTPRATPAAWIALAALALAGTRAEAQHLWGGSAATSAPAQSGAAAQPGAYAVYPAGYTSTEFRL